VTTTADDIEDTTGEMKETEAFVANLASQCAAKKKEWDERCAMRAEEIAAISEAIKILNDDDALDLFKKTLSLSQTPSAFLQRKSGASVALRVRTMLSKVAVSGGSQQTALALLGFQLKAKKVDFSKILAQIDGMMKVLDSDQKNDDEQFKFCEAEISKTDKESAATTEAIATSTASIEEMSDESETLASEIASLQDEIKVLDKAVAEATEQRKEEHADRVPIGILARPDHTLAPLKSKMARTFSYCRLRTSQSRNLGNLEAPYWCYKNLPLLNVSSSQIRAL
jgi:chromosome segregation ATPase